MGIPVSTPRQGEIVITVTNWRNDPPPPPHFRGGISFPQHDKTVTGKVIPPSPARCILGP